MKTNLFFTKLIIPILFFVVGFGNFWGQTYTGTPTTSGGAVCPSGTTGSGCSLTFNPKYKLYVTSISGSTVNLRLEVCTGSTLSTGTFYLKEGDACGNVVQNWPVSSTSGPYNFSINVNHIGTKTYTMTNVSSSGTSRAYSNSITITGTSSLPPTLKSEASCFNISSVSLNEGGNLSGTITVRNIGSTSYSGTLTVFISKTTSSSTQEVLRQQAYTISANSIQSISFNKTLTSSPGTYRIWCKYSNAPNGGEQYIENNGCTTCSGLGCLSTSTPTSLITINGTPNLVCGTATVNPTQPIQNQNATFSFPISNTGSANYTGQLKMMWRNSSNVGVQLGNTLFGLSSGASHTFTASSTPLVSSPGTYYLRIEDINDNVICTQTVTVAAAPAGCVSWTGTPPTGEKLTAAEYLCSNGIIINTQNGTDNANNSIPRELLAKVTYLGIYKGITPNSPAVNFPVPFTDMQGSYTQYMDAIKTLAYLQFSDDITPFDRDLINFNPSDLIQRKYALKVLLEAFNIPLSNNTTSPYTDINNSDPQFKYIRTAYELNLLPSGNIFNVGGNINITREDLFVALWKILSTTSIPKPTLTQLGSNSSYFIPGNNRTATFGKVPSLDQANFNHYQKTSFSIAARGIPLDFTHTYNSFLTELPKGFFEDINSTNADRQKFTPLGIGWTHTYNIYAVKVDGYTIGSHTEPAKIMFYYPDGSINIYDYATLQPDVNSIGNYDIVSRVSTSDGEKITVSTKGQMKYVFENRNYGKHYFIQNIKDRNGNGVKMTWNQQPTFYKLTKVEEIFSNGSTGRSLSFNYEFNLSQKLKSVTDNSLGRTIEFNVDTNWDLLSFKDPKGQITSYNYESITNYNTSHLLKEIILPKGNKIRNTYVNRKLISSQTLSQANVATSTTNVNWTPNYSSSGYNSSATITDPQERESDYIHNTLGNPTQIVTPTGTTTFNGYGSGNNANLPTNLTVNGQSSSISYDTKGNVLNITKNGITNSFTYTSLNDVLTHTDGRGFTTNYSYDGVGNLTSVQRPSGGGTTTISRNSFGQVQSVTNPSGITTQFGYNTNGLTNQISMPLGISTSSTYDNASRLLSTTDANGKVTSFQYDPNDNLTQSTDANNQPVLHTYDANDNHLTIKNPKNETQTNNYNFDDDLLASEVFGSHTKSYTYNVDGSLATHTRGNGTFTYSYDNTTGRLTSDGHTSYAYDTRGNITSITNSNGTLTLNYDNNDRMTSYSDYYGNTVSYLYDNNNNVTRITYPGNKQVNYVYDANNRCTSVTDWNNKVTSYTYLADDRVSKITLPNGTFTDYTYDAAGRMTGINNKKANGTVITSYAFTMDNAGNHLTETITEPSITAGLQTVANETINYGQYPFNRIQSQGSTSFTHNTAGGITQAGSNAYTYDINDNMLTAPNSSFSYDGAGNRRAKTVSGANTRYVLSILGMSQVLMETNSSNVVQNYYVYGPTGLLYRVKADNATYSYYHYDYRGSTTAITNEAQNITHSYSYDPFGKVLAKTEADANPFQYVGKYGVQYESPTLTFMRARYYDPTIGRFVSEDPIWALNLYPYADNNPIMGIDPKGEMPILSETLDFLGRNHEVITTAIPIITTAIKTATYVPVGAALKAAGTLTASQVVALDAAYAKALAAAYGATGVTGSSAAGGTTVAGIASANFIAIVGLSTAAVVSISLAVLSSQPELALKYCREIFGPTKGYRVWRAWYNIPKN